MSDELHRMVGEIGAKVDSLTSTVERYIEAHEKRHEKIDEQISAAHADINQAKGAKGAILTMAALIAGLVGAAIAAAERLFKG